MVNGQWLHPRPIADCLFPVFHCPFTIAASLNASMCSRLLGVLDLGIQGSLSCSGSTSAATRAAEYERRADRDQRSGQRSRDVDPEAREVRSDKIGIEPHGKVD